MRELWSRTRRMKMPFDFSAWSAPYNIARHELPCNFRTCVVGDRAQQCRRFAHRVLVRQKPGTYGVQNEMTVLVLQMVVLCLLVGATSYGRFTFRILRR